MQNLRALFIENDIHPCKVIQGRTALLWNYEKEIQTGYPNATTTSFKKTKNYGVLILTFTLKDGSDHTNKLYYIKKH